MSYILSFMLVFLSFSPIMQAAESEPLHTGTIAAFEKVHGSWGGPYWQKGESVYDRLWETLYLEVKFPETGETIHTFETPLNLEDFIVAPGDEIVILDIVIGDLFTDTVFFAKIAGKDRLFQIHRTFHQVHPTFFPIAPKSYANGSHGW